MTLKQTINFSVANPSATENFSLPLYNYCDYEPAYRCWSIGRVNGFFKFNLSLPQQQGINLVLQLCSSIYNGVMNCPISISVNGNLLVSAFDPHIDDFYDMVWSVPASMLNAGNNEIIVTLIGGTSKVFLRYAIVDLAASSSNHATWLSGMPDSTLISDINLPGTHDSAAINSSVHTPYACHRYSITDQLKGGVRLLDVRLKVQGSSGNYGFVTCHGAIGSSTGINEYQSFPSLLDECRNFLLSSPTEMVVMSLKIDDWNGSEGDASNVCSAIASLFSGYPTSQSASIPTLGAVRGKIWLFSRISQVTQLGVPIAWQDNTSGSFAYQNPNRSFNVYVQDQYQGLPNFGSVSYKLNLVTATFGQKQPSMVVLNYASAVWYGVIGVYIMGDLLSYFGTMSARQRPRQLGWILFDYQFESYNTSSYGWLTIVDLIIASNSNYQGFTDTFTVLSHDEL